MNRNGIAACIMALCLTACSSCSSGGSGNDGGSGGSCKNVVVCTLITQAQVSSSLGVMATVSTPSTANTGDLVEDDCVYTNPSPAANTNVSLFRTCYGNPQAPPAPVYDQSHMAYLAPMGTRTDLTGVGDKAFYQSEPQGTMNVSKVKLVALKGQILVILEDASVPPAQEAMVKQGLTSFANTLLQ